MSLSTSPRINIKQKDTKVLGSYDMRVQCYVTTLMTFIIIVPDVTQFD